MEIIKVDESFAERIGQVHATAWQQAYKNIFTDDYILQDSPEKRKEECLDTLREKRGDYYLLNSENGPAGIMKVSTKEKKVCEIESIYLLNDFKNRGYGSAAMDFIKSEFSDRTIVLWVLENNHRAIQFYKKNHFIFTGETRTIFRGKEYTQLRAVIMN